jgi:hypothetical protein
VKPQDILELTTSYVVGYQDATLDFELRTQVAQMKASGLEYRHTSGDRDCRCDEVGVGPPDSVYCEDCGGVGEPLGS